MVEFWQPRQPSKTNVRTSVALIIFRSLHLPSTSAMDSCSQRVSKAMPDNSEYEARGKSPSFIELRDGIEQRELFHYRDAVAKAFPSLHTVLYEHLGHAIGTASPELTLTAVSCSLSLLFRAHKTWSPGFDTGRYSREESASFNLRFGYPCRCRYQYTVCACNIAASPSVPINRGFEKVFFFFTYWTRRLTDPPRVRKSQVNTNSCLRESRLTITNNAIY